jgi:hypothetical protein
MGLSIYISGYASLVFRNSMTIADNLSRIEYCPPLAKQYLSCQYPQIIREDSSPEIKKDVP